MALKKNRILRRHPRTGVTPYEAKAKSFKQQRKGRSKDISLTGSDKLIYELVENNVDYAAVQFTNNLRYNTEVLTDILYDNLYYLLGEKFKEDEFVDWVAEELLKEGCVTKNVSGKQEQEVVVEIDDSQYTELKENVRLAIKHVNEDKVNIFRLFADVDDTFKKIDDERKNNGHESQRRLLDQ